MEGRLHGLRGAFAYGVTGLVLLFVLAPLAVAVALSFSDSPFVVFPPQGFTIHWYTDVLTDPDFLDSARFSIGLAFAATVAALVLGVPAALALVRGSFIGRGALQSFLLSPLVFPALITGLALLQFFSAANMQDAGVNLFFAHVLITLPYVVRTVAASLLLVDRSLEEAARTLGANRWRTFRRVTLPQVAPGVSAGALFAFMVSLDNFPISMWLANAENNPLPMLIFQRMNSMFDPSVAAMASLMILVGAAAVLILERLVGLRRAMGL
jgi:putative spermidine/putrescine transport system permease protein